MTSAATGTAGRGWPGRRRTRRLEIGSLRRRSPSGCAWSATRRGTAGPCPPATGRGGPPARTPTRCARAGATTARSEWRPAFAVAPTSTLPWRSSRSPTRRARASTRRRSARGRWPAGSRRTSSTGWTPRAPPFATRPACHHRALAAAPEWRARLRGFLELHIDQSRDLARAGAPFGVVSGLGGAAARRGDAPRPRRPRRHDATGRARGRAARRRPAHPARQRTRSSPHAGNSGPHHRRAQRAHHGPLAGARVARRARRRPLGAGCLARRSRGPRGGPKSH